MLAKPLKNACYENYSDYKSFDRLVDDSADDIIGVLQIDT